VNSWIRVAVLTVAVGIALLSVAEPAHAATGVSANPGLGVLTVSAASGRSNVIVVERQGGDFVVRDVGDPVSAGTGCMPVSATTVRCSATGIFRISVSAGDLNDTITKTTSTPGSLIGGTGNDTIHAGPAVGGGNNLFGGIGNDTLVGGANSDFLDGGSGADALLDIGGGSGAYDIELCRRNPSLRATVFDLPPVCKTATEKVGSAGFGDRIEVTPGDFLADAELPAGHDVVLLSMIMHDWTPAQDLAILRKCFAALPSGGQIVISELLVNDDKTGPPAAALMSLNMLVETVGRNYTPAEYATWLPQGLWTWRPCGSKLPAQTARASPQTMTASGATSASSTVSWRDSTITSHNSLTA
jgi:O-methyltransferase domain/RTX calcium-binding nonapeptide repeat (4 copies)